MWWLHIIKWHCVCILHISATHIEFGGAPLCQLFPLTNTVRHCGKKTGFCIVLHSNLDTCFDAQAWEVEKTSEAQPEMQRIWNKTRKWMQCSTWIVRLLQKFPNKFVKFIYHDVAAGFAANSRSCSKCLTTMPTYLPIHLVSEDDRTFQEELPIAFWNSLKRGPRLVQRFVVQALQPDCNMDASAFWCCRDAEWYRRCRGWGHAMSDLLMPFYAPIPLQFWKVEVYISIQFMYTIFVSLLYNNVYIYI